MLIYVIENRHDGRMYVGSTSQSFTDRISKHKYKAKAGVVRPLYDDMRRLGVAAFDYRQLAVCHDKAEALSIEAELIRRLKTTTADGGYNVAVDGASNCGGRSSQLTRKKLSVAQTTRWKLRLGDARLNEHGSFKQITRSNKAFILAERANGSSYRAIASALGCTAGAVCYAVKRWEKAHG